MSGFSLFAKCFHDPRVYTALDSLAYGTENFPPSGLYLLRP
jgi:hypothetical protein